MIIREANIKDAFSIGKISCDDLGYECDDALVSYRLSNLDSKREVVFVAEIDENVVGYVHAETYDVLYSESMINILGLAVASAYRRNGAGKALLLEVENWAKKLGINKIRLNSGSARKEAHEFYRVMGYDSRKEQIRLIKDLD